MPTNLSYPLLNQPLVDPRGFLARPWQQFFEALAIRVGADRAMTNLELEEAGNVIQGTLSAQLAAQAAQLAAQTAALEAQQITEAFSPPPAPPQPVDRAPRVPPPALVTPALPLWGQEGALVRDLLGRVLSLESVGTPTTGSWTPTLKGDATAGTQGYSVQVGRYWHWQGLLFATFSLVLSSTSGMAGNVHIAGLPVASLNVTNVVHAAMFTTYDVLNFSAGYTQLTGQLESNDTRIFLVETGDNLAGQKIQAAAIAATSAVLGSILYRT